MVKSSSIILIFIAVVIVAATAYGYQTTDNPGIKGHPEIRVTPTSHDFGEIPKEAVNYTFTVENTGIGPLEIKKVSTSCACTTAKIDSERIEQGQSASMLVTFDPNAMEKIEENVFRIVYIKSNDPEQPEVEIEIRAKVIGGENV